MPELRDHLVWSGERKMWWGPNELGYTDELQRAGWYTARDAHGIEAMSRARAVDRAPSVAVCAGALLAIGVVLADGLSPEAMRAPLRCERAT